MNAEESLNPKQKPKAVAHSRAMGLADRQATESANENMAAGASGRNHAGGRPDTAAGMGEQAGERADDLVCDQAGEPTDGRESDHACERAVASAQEGAWLRQTASPHCAEQPESEGCTYGYARVSSRDQNLSRQIDAFLNFGIARKNIFSEKASGKDFERPRYKALLRRLKPGDIVVIKSIDRLGRNYEEILEEWRTITRKRKAAIVVLDMPLLDTRVTKGNLTGVFIADIMLQLLSYIAQIERENTRQRQAEGIAAAQARGVKFGRPAKPKPEGWPQARREYLDGKLTRAQAAASLGVCRSTFDKWMAEGKSKATRTPALGQSAGSQAE